MEMYFEHMSHINVKVDYTVCHLCCSVVFTSEQLTLSTTKVFMYKFADDWLL